MVNATSAKPLRVPCRPLQLDNPILDVLEIAAIPFLLRGIKTWIQSFFSQEKKPQIIEQKPADLKINLADGISLSAVITCNGGITNPTLSMRKT